MHLGFNNMPSSSETTLYVDKDSDLAVVVDTVLRSAAKKIFLVIPEDARFANHILNFQLLARESEAVRKEVIIVSLDIRVQGLASKSGMKVHHLSEEFGVKATDEEDEKKEEIVRLAPSRVADITIPGGRRPPSSRVSQKPVQDSGLRGVQPFLRKRSQAEKSETIHVTVQEDGFMPKEEKSAAPAPLSSFSTGSLLKKFALYAPSAPAPDNEASEHEDSESIFSKPEAPRYVDAWQPKKRKLFSFPSIPLFARNRDIFSYVFAGFVISAVLIGGYVASITLPSAVVTLYPHVDTQIAVIPLRVETTASGVDEKNNLIGGQILKESQEAAQTFQASGQQNIEQYASGKIRVYNEFSSAPQTLVSGTRFVSNDGLLFRTDETVVVEGAQIDRGKIVASSTLVNVRAAETGEQYNISASSFSIPGFKGTPKFTAFYGKSDAPMAGGFKGTARIITDSDMSKAKDTLLKTLDGRAADKLRSSIPQGYFLAPDALTDIPVTFTFDRKSGERADSFSGKAVSASTALVFKRDDVNKIIDTYFSNSIANVENLKILPDKNITYTFNKRDFPNGKFSLALDVRQPIGRVIGIEPLRNDLSGLNEQGSQAYLSTLQGIDKAEVKFWPFWVHSIPRNKEKIKIDIEYVIK